ncbi:uncharacterized protein JCM10292_002613 [Rhodotorula paludigena]|uniref:uncharacterized protein n=1 Tax=Rhodotorula paludigena TaxID=86838 RepID=UPI003182226A
MPSTHGNALRKAWQNSGARATFTTKNRDLPQQHKSLLGKSVKQHRLLTQPKKQSTRTLLAIFIERGFFTFDDFQSTIPKLDCDPADTHDQGLSKEETQAIVTQIGYKLGKNRKNAKDNKAWQFVQDLCEPTNRPGHGHDQI